MLMNRLYALKNVKKYVRNSLIHININSLRHVNLLQKSNFFISTFFDQEEEELLEEETKIKKESINNKAKNLNEQKTENPYENLYSENLKQFVKQVSEETAFYVAPLEHSKTFHYASYFLPIVRILHTKNLIKDEKFLVNIFRQVKNSIKPTKEKIFTPQSVVKLMEEFSMIDFDGDESICLNSMLNYAEENCIYFTEVEWERFKAAYKIIMVNKAIGPVKFKPLRAEKSYESESERKQIVIKESLKDFYQISEDDIDKEITINTRTDKKWIIIKIPSKKLTIFTYLKSLSLEREQAYSYIYDLKQAINSIVAKTSREKNKFLLENLKINIQIREYLESNENFNYEHVTEKNLVYRQKKEIVDEFEKYENMKKMSLQEQIEKMKEKKKQLKQREKFKEKQKNIENPIKLENKNKQFDFFETLKYSINLIQEETLEKLNKRKTSNEISKKKKKKAVKKEEHIEDDEEMEEFDDENAEEEGENEEKDEREEKLEMSPKMIEKMKIDLEALNKKMAEKQEKILNKKVEKSELPLIQPFIKTEIEKITIEKLLNKALENNSLKEVKEFAAYVQIINSFNDIMEEIDKSERVKDYRKKVEESKKNESDKGIINEERFRLIRDEINESLDTNVEINESLENIIVKYINDASKEASNVNGTTNISEHCIIIMSEEELLNSIKAQEKMKYIKKNLDNKNSEKENIEENELKKIIFRQSFLL